MSKLVVMKSLFRFGILGSFLLAALLLPAQQNATDSGKANEEESDLKDYNALLFAPSFNAQFPVGTLANRFGFMGNAGFSFAYNFRRNWNVGVEGNFLFSNQVKEISILDQVSTATGSFISINGDLVTVKLSGRGFMGKMLFSKTIPLKKEKPGTGFFFQTGLGVMGHKILVDVRKDVLPQFNKTYRKGYDRMSVGPVFSQFIGFVILERKKFFNFYAGFQADLGITQNIRPLNFDTRTADKSRRADFLLGIKLGYYIPVFLNTARDEYYY